ncbi:hypothetical protein CBR_g51239 [Chara braunii]|uniref:Uncharacterized protein n=1 Tax=Chara braunii TaxID=69332 RepID=A0A388M8E7_CHABU|nr:hypothetical protein CBR_g51239 [Chara braunii]|eukprot:GBG90732.1 hypothetical protein CBR_g51239 [Chara braunii]
MELVGELQHGDTFCDTEDDVSQAEDDGKDEEDVVNYCAKMCARCVDWEVESEMSREVVVWDRDEHKGGAGRWWDNLMTLSYQVDAESVDVDGDTYPHQGSGDEAGGWEVELGFMAKAVVAVAERQGMGVMGAKGEKDDNNNNNNDNEQGMGETDETGVKDDNNNNNNDGDNNEAGEKDDNKAVVAMDERQGVGPDDNNNNNNNDNEQGMGEMDETGVKDDNNNNNNNNNGGDNNEAGEKGEEG